MRTGDISWLQLVRSYEVQGQRKRGRSVRDDHRIQCKLLKTLVHWVVTDVLIPLLRACFYVSEREAKSVVCSYYRKPVWAAIRRQATESCLPQYTPLVDEDRKSALEKLSTSLLGVSSVRLLPKASSVRAIANLSKRRCRGTGSFNPSTNMTLAPLYHVMRFECDENPGILGFAVSGLDQISEKIRAFVGTRTGNERKFYFVSSDVAQCYDRIDQKRLFEIASRLFTQESYLVSKSTIISRGSRVRHERSVSTLGGLRPVWNRAMRLAERNLHSVIIEGAVGSVVHRDSLLKMLWQHIFEHTIQISARGTQFFRQHMGIAQGSILSALLCNIYYGHLETSVLPQYLNSDSLVVMRLMDDYLAITSTEDEAHRFWSVLDDADQNGHFTLNRDKTRTNVPGLQGSDLVNCQWFPWCGVELNVENLNVRPNMQRYFTTSPFDALTVERGSPGVSLLKKMKHYMAPWAHPLLFDTNLNLVRTAYENVYCLALLCATKSHAHMRSLPQHGGNSNSAFIIRAIECSATYLSQLIRRRIAKHRGDESNETSHELGRCECSVRSDFIVWLGLHAFRATIEFKGTNKHMKPVHDHLQVVLSLPRYRNAQSALSSPARLLAEAMLPKFAW
mmetsp:Transcript_12041/g.23862  ORF Transcript_12041/g.23862 Transcript_12041/m.23862 type:complete len:620 (-) Transcript_12041:273-2132(-)